MTTPDGHIFISYARADGSTHAADLQSRLEARGYPCWRDTRDLNRTQDFTAEIEVAIKASTFVVVCITPDTARSESFVRREIQYALLCEKPVIVAQFDKDTLPPVHIITNTWDTPALPSPLPANGIWAPDIVVDDHNNQCYITGGATTPGIGDLVALYQYDPASNSATLLGHFTHIPGGFDFHREFLEAPGEKYHLSYVGEEALGEVASALVEEAALLLVFESFGNGHHAEVVCQRHDGACDRVRSVIGEVADEAPAVEPDEEPEAAEAEADPAGDVSGAARVRTVVDLRPDVLRELAVIDRIDRQERLSSLTVTLGAILDGSAPDVALQERDVLHVFAKGEMLDREQVRIRGDVREPGEFEYRRGMTLRDLIVRAGGIPAHGDVSRVDVRK